MITAAVSSASEFTGRPSSEWMLLALACAFANEVIGQCLAAVPPYPAQSVDWEIRGSVRNALVSGIGAEQLPQYVRMISGCRCALS